MNRDPICKITKNKKQLYILYSDFDRICSKYQLMMSLGSSWIKIKSQLWDDMYNHPYYYNNFCPDEYYEASVEFGKIQDMKDWLCLTDDFATKTMIDVFGIEEAAE